jgi:hypothetical protein
MLMAQVEGLMQNVGKDVLPRLVVQAAIEAEGAVLPLLERMAGLDAEAADATLPTPFSTPSDADWDLMVSRDDQCVAQPC